MRFVVNTAIFVCRAFHTHRELSQQLEVLEPPDKYLFIAAAAGQELAIAADGDCQDVIRVALAIRKIGVE